MKTLSNLHYERRIGETIRYTILFIIAFLGFYNPCKSQITETEPNDYNGKYNTAILYYNKAVNIINTARYDITLAQLSDLQDTNIVLCKQALPCMEMGFEEEPENENILVEFNLIPICALLFNINQAERFPFCNCWSTPITLLEKQGTFLN